MLTEAQLAVDGSRLSVNSIQPGCRRVRKVAMDHGDHEVTAVGEKHRLGEGERRALAKRWKLDAHSELSGMRVD